MESLGEEPETEETSPRPGGSGVVIFQAALCALALLALVALKWTGSETYDRFTGWYKQEAAREIQLPSLNWPGREPEAKPSPAPTALPSAASADPEPAPEIGSLQEI